MPFSNEARVEEARRLLRDAQRVLILSGQGLSIASSVPALRGPYGPWEGEEIRRWLDPEQQYRDPRRCWETFEGIRILMDLDRLTPAHEAIAKFLLTRKGVDHFTLAVDGMHDRAGVQTPEMMGSFHRYRCTNRDCLAVLPARRGRMAVSAFCPDCRAGLRHDLVLNGEQLRCAQEYHLALQIADVLVLAGTDGVVRGFDTSRWMQERDRPVIEVGESSGLVRRLLNANRIGLSADRALPLLLA